MTDEVKVIIDQPAVASSVEDAAGLAASQAAAATAMEAAARAVAVAAESEIGRAHV